MKQDEILSLNPYIFERPITDPKLFFGRKEELREIKMLLERAKKKRYQHIMIIGKRSIGKSSLLNRVVELSNKLGYITIKLPLDESAVKDPLDFFKTLYSMILDEMENKNIKIGFKERFLNAIEGLEIKGEIPLGFAKLYVQRKKSKVERKEVPYYILKKDFQYLFELVKDKTSSIVICIDEGDILTLNKELLQLIRNIFQEIEGYNLVLAGTDRLVEKISDVFSPIPRLFYKINLGPFRTEEEAEEAIIKPLENLRKSVNLPLYPPSSEVVEDIAKFSSYNPYEINLICYYAFEESVKKGKHSMELSPEVFERIKNQKRELTEYERQFYLLKKDEQDFLKDLVLFGGFSNLIDFAVIKTKPNKFEIWKKDYEKNYNKYQKLMRRLSNKNIRVDGKNPILKISIGNQQLEYFEIYDSWLMFFIKYVLLANIPNIGKRSGVLTLLEAYDKTLLAIIQKELKENILPNFGSWWGYLLDEKKYREEMEIKIKKEEEAKKLVVGRRDLYSFVEVFDIYEISSEKLEKIIKEFADITRLDYKIIHSH